MDLHQELQRREIQATKTHLDHMFAYFMSTLETRPDIDGCLAEAEQALRATTKTLSRLVDQLRDRSSEHMDAHEIKRHSDDASGIFEPIRLPLRPAEPTPCDHFLANLLKRLETPVAGQGTTCQVTSQAPSASGSIVHEATLEQKDQDLYHLSRSDSIYHLSSFIRQNAAPRASAVSRRRSPTQYTKIADNLKPSQLYANNNLDYHQINEVFKRSRSIPSLAIKVMMLLFDKAELQQCLNVYGRVRFGRGTSERFLDPKRVEIIRQIVQENSAGSAKVWKECVHYMNTRINVVKKKFHAQY